MSKVKKITGDLVYSITAVGIMNMVLQFIVYPLINYKIGSGKFGDMLFYMGVVNILAPSFGIAVNNTRLLLPDREKFFNKDFLYVLTIFSLISAIIGCGIGVYRKNFWLSTFFFLIIIISTIFRNYSSVEFRLTLNYKRQFVFYMILSVGYLLGLLLFWFSGRWELVYILGECSAVLFVAATGHIYNKLQNYSEKRNLVLKNSFTLALNYLITNLMLNLDRIVLLRFVGNEAVSQYYVLSLMGKTIAIISGPLNGILIGYLTKDNERIDRKGFIKAGGIMLAVGCVFLLGCLVATPIYIKIMYPNLYGSVISLNLIVNLSQILYFLAGILVVITLTVCPAKGVLMIQIIYSLIFIVLSVGLTNYFGIRGFSYAALASNMVYFILIYLLGFFCAKKKHNYVKEQGE